MSGNLCRCAAYPNIVAAIKQAKTRDAGGLIDAALRLSARRPIRRHARHSPRRMRPERRRSILAGGTTLLDLMKLDVMRPERVVDINALPGMRPRTDRGRRRRAAARRAGRGWPMPPSTPTSRATIPVDRAVAAARRQPRRSATWRRSAATCCSAPAAPTSATSSYANCNKRNPGSGCAALEGVNRSHAVLGTSDALHRHLSRRFRAGADRAGRAVSRSPARRGTRSIPFAELAPPAGR